MSAEQQYTPTTAETHEERQERSYLAAAHNQGNSREGRYVISPILKSIPSFKY